MADSKKSTTAHKAKSSKTKPSKHFRVSDLKFVRKLKRLRTSSAHKSFALTKRRDIPKRAKLPGYIMFTVLVSQKVWEFRRVFLTLLSLYVLTALLLIGYSQQDQYRSLTEALGDVAKEAGTDGLDTMTQAAGLFGASVIGSLNSSFTEMQQFYLVVLYVIMWLVVVWLLRQMLAGNVVKVRDGLYNGGTPLIPSVFIVAFMMIQALPGAIGILLFSSVTQNNIATNGVVAMSFGVVAILLGVLSLYWLTSSFIALIIVTLPGTYPVVALRGASRIALGRRSQLLFRLLWLAALLLVIWIAILVPVLLIDLWMKVSILPIVVIAIQAATGASFIFGITYIFMLYQRMIDDSGE